VRFTAITATAVDEQSIDIPLISTTITSN